MKEVDYIFQNLDTEGFLNTLNKYSGDQMGPGFLVSRHVKDCNEKVLDFINHLVIKGIFFQKAKDLSLIYHGYLDFIDNEDLCASISCFFSKTDNKYRLLIYSFLDKDFYQIVKIYKDKPSIQEIEDDLKEFDNKEYKKNLEIYNYEGSLLGLNDEEKEQYKDEINLER